MNFIKDIKDKLDKLSDNIERNVAPNLEFDYIGYSVADKTKLSYIHQSRYKLFDGDFWDEDLRKKYAVQIKPHKLLKTIFPEFRESTINTIFYALFPIEYEVKVLEGDDINMIFDISKLHTDNGNLRSCMVSNYDLRKYEIYRDHCKAVVLMDSEGMINARAIIWPKVKTEDSKEISYMDRIYYRNSDQMETLIAWAKSQGYIYRSCNGQSFNGYIGKLSGDTLSVTLDKNPDTYERLPYMDTFKYANEGDPVLSTNSYKCTVELTDHQQGTPFNRKVDCCCGCGLSGDPGDDFISVNGGRYHEDCDTICYSNRYSEHILRERASYCDQISSFVYSDDEDFVTDIHGDLVLECDTVRIEGGDNEGEYCLRGQYRRCTVCNNILHEDDDDCCDPEPEPEVVQEKELQLELELDA